MFNNLPLVSVVIPNFNYSKYVCEAIDSVISQSYKNIEIIVVDDGSTDNSVELISQNYPGIKLIVKENGGVSSARNLGITESKGEYICFLDSDDVWNEKKIERQLEVALGNKSLFVYTGFTACDYELISYQRFLPRFHGDCQIYYRLKPTSAIALLGTSTAMISRELMSEVGFFDTDLKTSADWDFMRRLSKIAFFDFVSDSLVMYRRHSENMSAGALEIYYRDNEIAVKKMVREYQGTGLKNAIINRISLANFYIGALKAFFKSGEFTHAAKHAVKLFNAVF